MPSIGQENLETVMIDFLGALRRGDFEAAAGLLNRDVSWQGLREEWVCHGREEVVDTFRWGLEQRREIDALEFTRGGEQIVLGAHGPNIGPGGRAPGPDLQRLHAARRTDRPHRRLPGPQGGAHGSRRRRGRGLALITNSSAAVKEASQTQLCAYLSIALPDRPRHERAVRPLVDGPGSSVGHRCLRDQGGSRKLARRRLVANSVRRLPRKRLGLATRVARGQIGSRVKSIHDPHGMHRLRLRPVPVPGLQQQEIALARAR
jgi:hypothetical protein